MCKFEAQFCVLRPAPTYETATTRQFYHGRTETVRSCTSEAIEFCKEMCNKDKSTRICDRGLLDLFKKACSKHDKLMGEARNNSGCDRHLLGLMLTADSLKLDLPEIYKDASWTKRFLNFFKMLHEFI
jgi:carnitine O-octanoyltransferase